MTLKSSKVPRIQGLLAEEAEKEAPTPAALDREAAQAAPDGIAEETEHATVPHGDGLHDRGLALLFGVLRPDGVEVLGQHGLALVLLPPCHHLTEDRIPVELDQVHAHRLGEPHLVFREQRDDVAIDAVVLAELDGLGDGRRLVRLERERLDDGADERLVRGGLRRDQLDDELAFTAEHCPGDVRTADDVQQRFVFATRPVIVLTHVRILSG